MFIARSYRAKIIAYITPLIGSICFLYFAFFLYRSSRIFKEELIDKGFSLSKALSYSCELGVLSEDEVFLKSSLVGILEEEDVLSAIVYNEEGKAIASNEKVEAELNIPPQILKRIKEERQPLRVVAYTERGEETYGFISPILATSFISGANTGAQREVVGFTKVILSLKRVRAQNRLMLITALMMTILIIGLGVGISTILAKGVTRPIGDLVEGVRAISQGNLNYRIQVKSKDEIGQLALSFNQMTEDLKERTRQAKESEERYKNLFESVKDAVFTSDKQGRLTDVNRAFLKMFGYKDREEVIGCDIAEKFYLRGEEGRKLAKRLKEKGFVTDYEIEVKKKDGTPFFISATSNLKRDEEGEIIGTEGILRDVTERKKMEQKLQDYTENLEKRVEERTKELKEANKELEDALTNLKNLQSQLLQSEKMASIGQLAAGVAHEMNNPIGFIHCNLETLQGYVEDVTRLLHKYDELEGVLQGSKREEADSIHQQLEDLKKEITDIANITEIIGYYLDFRKKNKISANWDMFKFKWQNPLYNLYEKEIQELKLSKKGYRELEALHQEKREAFEKKQNELTKIQSNLEDLQRHKSELLNEREHKNVVIESVDSECINLQSEIKDTENDYLALKESFASKLKASSYDKYSEEIRRLNLAESDCEKLKVILESKQGERETLQSMVMKRKNELEGLKLTKKEKNSVVKDEQKLRGFVDNDITFVDALRKLQL